MTPTELIKRFGSITAAARSLGLTRQAVQHWKRKGKIPERTMAWIEKQLRSETK